MLGPVLTSIDMVAIYVHDWPAAVRWYENMLGLETLCREEHHAFAVLGLPSGGAVLHLVGDATRPLGSRNRCVANFGVEDFDGALAARRERRVEIVEVQEDADDGHRLVTIADPEGNELNLYVLVGSA